MTQAISAINWNKVPDPIDKQVWDRLTTNFWLPEKVPVSNDVPGWNKMTKQEQEVIEKVFATLTLLDTLQGNMGAETMKWSTNTPHSEAVFANIQFMEHVHAKSYSTIFSTLCSSERIDQLFRWVVEDELLQKQADTIYQGYQSVGAQALATGVLLESFLFYSGFYAPLRFAAEGRLTNTADIIRLIMRDEGVHGYYAGYWFQKLNPTEEDKQYVLDLTAKLYSVEVQRAEQLYDGVGWTEDVKSYLRYNANRALANLGMEPVFSAQDTQIPAYIKSALDPGTGEAHDFFSGSGASYVMGEVEETADEDWSW